MLEAIHLTKRYEKHIALNDLSLTVQPGEIFCLLGANGAGKTTTINLFLNFVDPTSGVARIDGIDVVKAPVESKTKLAYIPEQVALYRNLTGLENIAYFTAVAGDGEHGEEALHRYLREAGLQADAHDKRVSSYSKGMRQKVGIAIAIAKQAKVLLLDEPTSGLDPQASNEFSELLRLMSSRGTAILMATHDLFRAKETGTRLGIMRGGQLRQTLNADEIGHSDLERLYIEHMRA